MAQVTINGKTIDAKDGSTILQVIKDHNLAEIPTLCYSEHLEPYTSCFLCSVEVQGMRGLKPACATEVSDGMVVETENSKVNSSRKTNLELLLSNHRADCFPPCRLGCPAEVDIQGYIALASRGLYLEGQKLMLENNPLTMVCGRICARPCESQCRRNYVDEPVDIKNIKRFMADMDLKQETKWMPDPGADTGKHVAIVGSGPAGLTAAYYLRLKGHGCTIFEMMPEPGGMMRYGIPEYRLPKKDLRIEIDSILNMGVELKCNTKLGEDISMEDLNKEYDAVYLGTGAWIGSTMGVPGEDFAGVTQGVDFLREVNEGKDVSVPDKVFIIGGGNTAIDAARTALRLGAGKVTMIYRRTEAEMPADNEEIDDAKKEGIEIRILNNPVSYNGENGTLKSVNLVKMELGEPDASGRRRPQVIEGSEYTEEVDLVIEAIGQKVDDKFLPGIDMTKWGTIAADDKLFTTSMKGVFAGGDAVMGPDIVIGAVAHGRKGADVIDQYLNGVDLKPENRLGFKIRKEDFGPVSSEEFAHEEKKPRNHMAKVPVAERVSSFVEVETGFTEEQLQKEAARCLECGCQDVYECSLREYSDTYGADTSKLLTGELRTKSYESDHRYIQINTEKCINCGQCVRVCSEIQKQSVFAIDQRGFQSTPAPVQFKSLDDTTCISCGLCASVCPVGAIHEKLPLGKPGPFKQRITESTCYLCGDACAMTVETRDDHFMKISSKKGNHQFFDHLCEKGRFDYDQYVDRTSVISGGSAEDVSAALDKLTDSSVVALTPGVTIEEMDQLLSFAEKKGAYVYSTEVEAVKEKISLVKNSGASFLNNLPDTREYDGVYIFGSFDEEGNSVYMRKALRYDKESSIHYSFQRDDMYFKGTSYQSDGELLAAMKSAQGKILTVFTLQNTEKDVINDVLESAKNKSDVVVLNSSVNLFYLHDRMEHLNSGREIPKRTDVVVSYDDPVALEEMSAKTTVYFVQGTPVAEATLVVPVPSPYEKTGTIIDQFGEKKQVIRAAKPESEPLGSYLSR